MVKDANGPCGSSDLAPHRRGEADITGLGTTGITRAILDETVSEPGIWLAEQVVAPTRFWALSIDDGGVHPSRQGDDK